MNSVRATCWSLTINNPTQEDEEQIALARQRGWKVDGQKEQGLLGTQHYQLMLRTPQVRMTAVKKLFRRAHIEVARNPAALEAYVHKEDTRAGQLPTSQDKYPSLSKFWHMIYDHYNTMDKDGFDYMAFEHGMCKFYNEDLQSKWATSPLCMLDNAVAHMIIDGYYVEGIAFNPSTRSVWKNMWQAIMVRCYNEKQILDKEVQQDVSRRGNGFGTELFIDETLREEDTVSIPEVSCSEGGSSEEGSEGSEASTGP